MVLFQSSFVILCSSHDTASVLQTVFCIYIQLATCHFTLVFVYFITWPDQDALHDLPLTNENLPFLITDDDTYLQTSIALPRFYHQPT